MNRVLIIIFILVSSFILYQILLGDNGVINGVLIRNENEKLKQYIEQLKRLKKDNQDFISGFNRNPESYKSYAEKLGFFEDENVHLIRIKDLSDDLQRFQGGKSVYAIENRIQKILSVEIDNKEMNKKLEDLRRVLTAVYIVFIGFFILLVFFMGLKRNDENRD